MSTKADSQHSEGEQETAHRRDALLLKLLKTSPQPRPKRERASVEKSTKRKPRKQQPSDE